MNVIKRSGEEKVFDPQKIFNAIKGVNNDLPDDMKINDEQITVIKDGVVFECEVFKRALNVEEIQNLVEKELMKNGYYEAAKQYVLYRYKRALARQKNTTDDRILSLIDGTNEELIQENSNKNPKVVSVQRDYMAGEVSKDLCRRFLYPKDVMEAHDSGLIHIHDLDYVALHITNCELINLEDMLQNGTVINGSAIDRPKSFLTACTVATQISAQVASNTFGGQTISLAHLSPFIDVSRQKYIKQIEEELGEVFVAKEKIREMAETRTRREVKAGVQTIQYQLSTILCSNGQAPFISMFMYLNEVPDGQQREDLALLIEEVLRQRIEGIKNAVGVPVTPAFPKLLFCVDTNTRDESCKYWYLTELAAKCTAKRLVPDYISEKKMLEYKIDGKGRGNVYGCMGCRAFLTPDCTGNGFNNVAKAKNWKPNESKYYGRFNLGACTLSLPYVALLANRDLDRFWSELDKAADLCYRAQQIRTKQLNNVKANIAPILWQYGAMARLDSDETLDKLIYGGYATISLGYNGLWECVMALIGKKLNEPEGEELGLKIMQRLNEYTAKWKAEQNIHYSLYGTPAETLAGKFMRAMQKRFGIIPGVTDRAYTTNAYHMHVSEPMSAFEKLEREARFQKLSPGGAISYVEVPNMQNNIPAVLSIIKFIYDNIMYAELNTKSDYCQVCKYDGEIKIVKDDHGKLVWECPKCGNRDQTKMNVARRTCG